MRGQRFLLSVPRPPLLGSMSASRRVLMNATERCLSRRGLLKILGMAGSGIAASRWLAPELTMAQQPAREKAMETFTGPGANPHWNSVGPYITGPQKAPLILLTDRPVQLETPRHYFRTAFTPNEAFYVRWHLEGIPNAVDLKNWKLQIEGNVNKPVALSLTELMQKFKAVSLAAVNQCSGNSRSRLQPRVPGGQWGNGAMGNAMWTGVRLRELLDMAGVKSGSLMVQFQGLETGAGPAGFGSNLFLKSLDLGSPVLDECLVAYRTTTANSRVETGRSTPKGEVRGLGATNIFSRILGSIPN